MLRFLLLILFFNLPWSLLTAQTFARGGNVEIPLLGGVSNPSWGAIARDADHATVAMNESGHVLVAYHSTRSDFTPALKQVELAFFEYDSVLDEWSLEEQLLIGDVGPSPLFAQYLQNDVKCERPDVIAVGDKFFVVWTRRYDRTTNWQEPAVLECAWLDWNGTSLDVFGMNVSGAGFLLDADYKIRECAGVPDAVVLNQPSGGDPTVGIIYPRQTDFSYDPGGGTPDDTRLFELAMVTCSIDSANQVTSQLPFTLPNTVVYDGSDGGAAGLVLPDLAPSSEENAFWLTYEGQQLVGPDTMGIVRLEYWSLNGTGVPEFAKTFKTTMATGTVIRRRPMISSLPGNGSVEMVSIAFNKTSPGADSDVIYEQWQYDTDSFQKVPVPFGHEFNNTAFNEGKPAPLHGPQTPYTRRCYFKKSNTGGSADGVYFYDLNSNTETVVAPSDTAARPAVSFGQPNGTDSIAVSWEDDLYFHVQLYKRIVLRVD